MTIASELEDLQTNLTNAKDAVVAKGGTVGDTGLAGLADEIGTIEGGGGSISYQTPYGRLWCVPWTTTAVENYVYGCSIVIDSEKFAAYIGSNPIQDEGWGTLEANFDYNVDDGTWSSWSFINPIYDMTTADLAEQVGVTVTLDGDDYAGFGLVIEEEIDEDGDWQPIDLSSSDWDSWSQGYSWGDYITHHPAGGLSVPSACFRRFEFGTENLTVDGNGDYGFLMGTGTVELGEVPDNISGFLSLNSMNLNSCVVAGRGLRAVLLWNCACKGLIYYPNAIQDTYNPSVDIRRGNSGSADNWNFPITLGPNMNRIVIGDSATFNHPLVLEGGKELHFDNLPAFNQPIIFPEGMKRIVFSGNSSFNQNVVLPSTLVTETTTYGNHSFFQNCDNMTGTINVGNLSPSVITGSYSGRIPCLATTDSNANCYTMGIKIAGANRQAWLNAFPNLNGESLTHFYGTWYRKLIDAGY